MTAAAPAGLQLHTPRLTLRVPDDDELRALARVAASGVHPPDEMPFLVPWTDGASEPGFADEFVAYHHHSRATWSAEDWLLEFGVWAGGTPIGVQAIGAEDFRRTRTVDTGSWLGERFQGQGFGTEMRAAVLALAFGELGAREAQTGAFDTSHASVGVSLKLGYAEGEREDRVIRGATVSQRRFTLSEAAWRAADHPPVTITGMPAERSAFGLSR